MEAAAHTRYTQRPHELEQLRKDQNIKKYNFTYCFNAPGVQPFTSKDKNTLELWCLKTGCWSFGWEVTWIWGKQNNDELRLYSSS